MGVGWGFDLPVQSMVDGSGFWVTVAEAEAEAVGGR